MATGAAGEAGEAGEAGGTGGAEGEPGRARTTKTATQALARANERLTRPIKCHVLSAFSGGKGGGAVPDVPIRPLDGQAFAAAAYAAARGGGVPRSLWGLLEGASLVVLECFMLGPARQAHPVVAIDA